LFSGAVISLGLFFQGIFSWVSCVLIYSLSILSRHTPFILTCLIFENIAVSHFHYKAK
jgi:hypothetical protein